MKAVLIRFLLAILIVVILDGGVQSQDHNHDHGHGENFFDTGLRDAAEGRFKEARSAFLTALKADPHNTDIDLSMRLIQDVLKKKVNRNAALRLFAAVSMNRKGNHGGALAELDMAVLDDPEYAHSYVIQGMIYAGQGDYDRAVSAFSEAVTKDEGIIKAYIYRGIAHARKNQIDLAVADYERALELDSNNTDALYNRGLASMRKGLYDFAVADFTRAVEFNSKYTNAYINRGYIYLMYLGEKEKGCSDWKEACNLGECNNYRLAQNEGKCE